jgi:hypothetical protein
MGILVFLIILFFAYLPVLEENIYWRTHPHRYLTDGTPVYLDRHGNMYINNERVDVIKLSGWRFIWMGRKTKTIYYDSKDPEKQFILTERDKLLGRAGNE